MKTVFRRVGALLMALCLFAPSGLALSSEERAALFDKALSGLQTPDEVRAQTGEIGLHTGDQLYVPCVSPGIVPFDEQGEAGLQPVKGGAFESSDESVVSVSDAGLLTGVSAGEASVTARTADGTFTYRVTVGADQLPALIQNYIYILRSEFYSVKRAKLPKYNKYAKWYYGRRKEVGWCSVFTIYCANAAGAQPLKRKEADAENPPMVQFFKEGQVGHQYDGFFDLGRFVDVPKPGYLVIYAELNNGYRTTHIGSVTDVRDLGGGRYAVTTVEGNMSNSVKSYCYVYDSSKANHLVGVEKGRKLQRNMEELPASEQTDPLVQYELHTDHWAVFGFGQTWE